MATVETKHNDSDEGSPSDMRGEGLHGSRRGEPGGAKQSGGASVAMPGASSPQVVHLTQREIFLHQAGQAIGEAAVYQSLAAHFGQLSQQYATAAKERYKTAAQLHAKAESVSPKPFTRVGNWFKARFARG